MSFPPRQERRGPWHWPGAPTDDRPPPLLWRPDTAYPKRHSVGDHHAGQRGMRRRRERRRDHGRRR